MTWVIEDDNGSRRELDTRAEAEDVKSELEDLGATVEMRKKTSSDGGKVELDNAEVIEMSQAGGNNTDTDDDSDTEPESAVEPQPVEDDIPDSPDVAEDPVSWMPGHFVDTIEGVPTINRKGYAVLAEHYDISVTAEVVTYPSETEFEYAEFEATAVTEDGREYSGFGSAHIDRGDDKTLLGEMAETRAVKRSLAIATGVGMTAIEEMRGSLGGGDQ